MEKINRLGWTVGKSFSAYGVTVGIRSNSEAIIEALPDLLPVGASIVEADIVDLLISVRVAPSSNRRGRRNYHLIYADAALIERTSDLDELMTRLEMHLQLLVAYWASDDQIFVHAGVVSWHGQAIVIPGRSHSGKTTLVAALLEAGADYLSDEFAILDQDGRVIPYRKPLSVRTPNGTRYVEATAPPDADEQASLPIGLIVITKYDEGASWRPRELSQGRAVMALFENTVAARRHPAVSLPVLSKATQHAQALKSTRGEAAGAVRELLKWIDHEFSDETIAMQPTEGSTSPT